MKRIIAAIVGLSLVAGCTDPTAVQKFAQSAPPAASYHALLLNYANLPAEEAGLARLEPIPNTDRIAKDIAETTRRCGQLLPLDNLHAAMIGYMAALGALATTGTTSSAASGPATQTPPSTQTTAPATPTGPQFCAATLPKPPAAAGTGTASGGPFSSGATSTGTAPSGTASPGKASSGAASASLKHPTAAQTATANGLSGNLTAFAVAFPELHITAAQAGTAGTLAQLVVDVATAGAREVAITNALKDGHDAFLAAIAVESSVVQYGLSASPGNTDSLQIYGSTLADKLNLILTNSQRPNQATAVRQTAALAVALANGTLLTPAQAANLGAAAQAYVSALGSLQKAYTDLTAAADTGEVFNAATWNRIEPLLSDVAAAYTAVNKL